MKKHKLNWKTKVWPKYAISFGALILATSITLGSLYAYSKKSSDRLGRENPTKPYFLRNKFVQTKDAKSYFVTSDKSKILANVDLDKEEVFFEENGKTKKMTVEEYVQHFYNVNKRYPTLNIKYGSFDFFNEYLEAVTAKDFKQFTDWFMFNVSWGPEIVTLKEFSIVKGVEMKGNSITLGSHSDQNKEYMTIKFYPDAFFGTLAAYSELSGRGNSSDALLYKLNKKLLTSSQVNKILTNTPGYNAAANMSNEATKKYSFRNIVDTRSLIGSKVYVLPNTKWTEKLKNHTLRDYEESRLLDKIYYSLIVQGKNRQEAENNLKQKIKEYKKYDKFGILNDIDVEDLQEKYIADVTFENNGANEENVIDRYLKLTFTDGTSYNLYDAFNKIKIHNALTDTDIDLPNCYNLNQALNYVKEIYSREIVRVNQGLSLIKERINSSIIDIKNENTDYESNKKELESLIEKKQKEIDEFNANNPSPLNPELTAKLTKLNNELKELKIDLKNLNDSHPKNLEKLENRLNLFKKQLNIFETFIKVKNDDYLELLAKKFETSNDILKQEEYATRMFNFAKDYQNKYLDIFNLLKLPSKVDEKELLSDSLVVYNQDLAYLPNQIISNEALKLTATNNYLNWRDFHNLNNFLNDKNNLNDEEANNFYAYSPYFKSLVEDYNKAHPNAKVKMQYKELIEELKSINSQKLNLTKKIDEIDEESKSLNNEYSGKIFNLLFHSFYFYDKETSSYEEGDLKIKDFIMPGTKSLNSPLYSTKEWEDFCKNNFENLDKYLELVKTKWETFYTSKKTFVENNKDLAKKIEELEKQLKKAQEDHPNWTTDWNVFNTYIKPLQDQLNLEKSKWETLKSDPNYVEYAEVSKMAQFDINLTNALVLTKKHKTKENEYYQTKIQIIKKDYQIRLIQFKLNYLLRTININDPKLAEYYQKYVEEYTKALSNELEQKIKIIEDKTRDFENKKQSYILDLLKNEDHIDEIVPLLKATPEVIQKSKDLITKIQEKNTLVNEIEDLKTEVFNLKKTEYTSKFDQIKTFATGTHKSLIETTIQKAKKTQKDLEKFFKDNEEKIKSNKLLIDDVNTSEDIKVYLKDENEKLEATNAIYKQIIESYKNLKKDLDSAQSSIEDILEDATEIDDEITLGALENYLEKSQKIKKQIDGLLVSINGLNTNLNDNKIAIENLKNTSTSNEIKEKCDSYLAILNAQTATIVDKENEINALKGNFSLSDLQSYITFYDTVQNNANIKTKIENLNGKKEALKVLEEQIRIAKEQGAIEINNSNTLTLVEKLKKELLDLDKDKNELLTLKDELNNDYPSVLNFDPDKGKGKFVELLRKIKERNQELILNSPIYQEAYENESSANSLTGYIKNLQRDIEKQEEKEELREAISEYDSAINKYVTSGNDLKEVEQKEAELTIKIKIVNKIIKELKNKDITDSNRIKFLPFYENALTLLEEELIENNEKSIEIKRLLGLAKEEVENALVALEVKQKNLKTKREKLNEELEKINKRFISKSYAHLDNDLKNDPVIKNLLEKLNATIKELDKAESNKNKKLLEYKKEISKFSELDFDKKYKKALPEFNEALENYYKGIYDNFELTFKVNSHLSYIENYLNLSDYVLENQKEKVKEINKNIAKKTDELATLNPTDPKKDELIKELATLNIELNKLNTSINEITTNKISLASEKEGIIDKENDENRVILAKANIHNQQIENNFKEGLSALESYFINYSIFSEVVKFYNNPLSIKNKAILNAINAASKLNKEVAITKAIFKNRDYLLSSNQNYHEIKNENDLILAKTKIELREKLLKKGIITKDTTEEEIDKLIKKVSVSSFNKDKRKLVFTLREKASYKEEWTHFGHKSTDTYAKFGIDAKANRNILSTATDLLATLGYKKVMVPRILREEGDIKNQQGNLEKGYALYSDGYENLLDEVLEKVPYAAEWLEGPHLEQEIDEETGEIKYVIKNGKYLGFTKDSRIGLWAILKATNPQFKGIAIDFLKFVAAHEYGHHMTLNGAQNLGDKNPNNRNLFVSALTPGATPGITNYYNREALDLYLKARTNLELATRSYLNGKYVRDEKNGEYPSFMYPKFDNQGKIIGYEEEKQEDIWGTEINDPDVTKAIKNKRRRFIQNFEGMKQALEERRKALNDKNKRISLFDLWLTNTLDTFSGTLNPSVSGEAKYMVWDATKKRYVFKKGSLEILKGILKDGAGKPIDIELNSDGSLNIQKAIADFEYVPEDKSKGIRGKFILKKVFINDNKNNPIINAPLNEDLYYKDGYGEKAVEYILNQIKEVQGNIETLIVKKFLINGWDDSTTALTIDPKMGINFTKLAELNRTAKDYKPTQDWYKEYVNNRDFAKGNMTAEHLSKPTHYYEEGNIYGQPLPSNIDKDNYFVNLTNKSTFYQELLELAVLGGSNGTRISTASGFETYINSNESYVSNANLENAFENNILYEDLGSALGEFNVKQILKPLNKYGSSLVGNSLEKHLWLATGDDGKLVGQFPNPQLKDLFDMQKTRKLLLNSALLSKNITDSLFNSIYHISGYNKLYGDDIFFNSVKEWMKFNSIDLTRAKLDNVNKKVNWDVSYVKTKFNIGAFRRALKVALLQDKSLDAPLKTKLTNLVEHGTEQDLANEIMARYAKSPLAAFTKSFKLMDLKTNPDLAWIFDQKIGFGKYKTNKFNVFGKDNEFEFGLDQLIKTIEDFANGAGINVNHLTSVDYLLLDNKITLQTEQMLACLINKRATLINILLTFVNGTFKKIAPSADALAYFNSKNERRFNEFFTDYTYNFAEVINRDNLQITYSPSKSNFGNMPSYLSGISEATTGLEYVVDATDTKKWLKSLIKFRDEDNKDSKASVLAALLYGNQIEDEEQQNIANSFGIKKEREALSDKEDFKDNFNFRNSYFGKLQTHNNGWFKDRWYREFLNFKLYDDEGKDIEDDSIRITDLEGNRVKTRARAYWQYYIQSQGVGRRTLSGIWRDKDKDAVAFYGYLPKHLTQKGNIKYLAFKDLKTGQIKTLPINIKNSNNMFYYKEQHLDNEENSKDKNKTKRHYLAEEKYKWSDSKGNIIAGIGFDSYVSDYAIVSKYSNALLTPGNEYEVYFASDEKGTFASEMYLGKTESVSENGKTYSQAPTSVRWENGKAIYKVQNQFNVY